MVGRLSTYAKNRILNLRFQQDLKITQIAKTLQNEDNIKVSRESVSAFIKKYSETKSIHDKPRPGRKKKLTDDEIKLIGELTKMNRDITAPKIKEYLNLNVSPYTILRATKLFEWNKFNPNSNEAKKQAAIERQLNEKKRRKIYPKKKKKKLDHTSECQTNAHERLNDHEYAIMLNSETNQSHNLNLINEQDLIQLKNQSSSPMVFATKLLYRMFTNDQIKGHYVCGKVLSKNAKNKQPLLDKRVLYIKWLVENNFDVQSNKSELWQQCRRAINKSILNNERRDFRPPYECINKSKSEKSRPDGITKSGQNIYYADNVSIDTEAYESTDFVCGIHDSFNTETETINMRKSDNDVLNGHRILTCEHEIDEQEIDTIRRLTNSPMVFAVKIFLRIFTVDELHATSFAKRVVDQLDRSRLAYIRHLVEKHYPDYPLERTWLWRACCKALNHAISQTDPTKAIHDGYMSSDKPAFKQTAIQDAHNSNVNNISSIDGLTLHKLESINVPQQVHNQQNIITANMQISYSDQRYYQLANNNIDHQHQLLPLPQQLIRQCAQFEDNSAHLSYHIQSNFYN